MSVGSSDTSLPVIPFELHNYVLEYAFASSDNPVKTGLFQASSLVCKSWLKISRRVFFPAVNLRSERRAHTFIDLIASPMASWTIIPYVKEVRIHEAKSARWTGGALSLIPPLLAAQSLILHTMHPVTDDIQRICPNLRRLHLSLPVIAKWTFDALSQLIGAFAALEQLQFDSMPFATQPGLTEESRVPHQLVYLDVQRPISRFMGALLSQPNNVTTLVFREVTSVCGAAIRDALKCVGEKLENLTLFASHPIWSVTDLGYSSFSANYLAQISLASLTSLKRLTVKPRTHNIVFQLAQFFSTIKSPHIEFIEFGIDERLHKKDMESPRTQAMTEWQCLDHSVPQSVRTLVIDVSYSTLPSTRRSVAVGKDELSVLMPSCVSRGILNVLTAPDNPKSSRI